MKQVMHFLAAGLLAFSAGAVARESKPAPAPAPAPAVIAGDPTHGEQLYEECKGCHAFKDNVVGPRHCGVVGRRAGTVPDYAYSDVMKASGVIWTEARLSEFLTSPISYMSGTNMGFAGYFDPKDRADVIAYLRQAGADPANCAEVSPQDMGVR